MEGNKDDSEKCLRLSEKYQKLGDLERAIKYAEKADRLYPTERTKRLINSIAKEAAEMASGASNGTSNGAMPNGDDHGAEASNGAEGPRQRSRRGNDEKETAVEKQYTQEQVNACKKALKCKDYYEILGVEKSCTDEDLKKAYRKLALKFHPDKNKAPGATDAFKAIGNAFSVLSCPQKRSRYDQYGLEEERTTHHHHHHHDFTRGDISPEELFNIFFGGGYPSGRVYRSGNRQRTFYREENNDSGYPMLLQLAPILLLVGLSLLSSFMVGDPAYSLSRTQKYGIERRTQNLHVPYYVKPKFHEEYKGSLRRLEQQVEEEFINHLRSECFRERSYKENMLWRARNFQDAHLYERAQDIKTPNCDRLQSIYS